MPRCILYSMDTSNIVKNIQQYTGKAYFISKKNTQSTLCLPYLLYIIMYKYKKRLNMVEN